MTEKIKEALQAMEANEPQANMYGAAEEYVSDQAYELLGIGDNDDFNKLAELMKQAVIYGAHWKEQQMIKSAKLEGWIARDEDDRLHLFEVKPRRLEKEHRWWDKDYHSTSLDEGDFPNLKWEDEPIYVKLIIIKEE